MAEWDVLMKALDTAHWELSEALQGLPNADAWKRPHPRLLSVGEQVAHIVYWEAQSFLGASAVSPLIVEVSRYYTATVDQSFELPIGADALSGEVKRVHEECRAAFLAQSPDLDAKNPHRGDWTWRSALEYQAFHVAYHTGQIYAVRHLLGHQTVDN